MRLNRKVDVYQPEYEFNKFHCLPACNSPLSPSCTPSMATVLLSPASKWIFHIPNGRIVLANKRISGISTSGQGLYQEAILGSGSTSTLGHHIRIQIRIRTSNQEQYQDLYQHLRSATVIKIINWFWIRIRTSDEYQDKDQNLDQDPDLRSGSGSGTKSVTGLGSRSGSGPHMRIRIRIRLGPQVWIGSSYGSRSGRGSGFRPQSKTKIKTQDHGHDHEWDLRSVSESVPGSAPQIRIK